MNSIPLESMVNHRRSAFKPIVMEQSSMAESPLETVYKLPRRPGYKPPGVVLENDAHGVAAEQFRLMQRRLTNFRPCGSSLLVTSAGVGEGKSLNAHNLAAALAESGQRTLLLELDLRKPTQASYLHSKPPLSVVDVLNGHATPMQAICQLSAFPLFFLGVNKAPPGPTALLRSTALRSLLRWAHEQFQWVVVDGPPVLPVADVDELLPSLDLVLLVVRERVTLAGSLRRVTARLGNRCNFVVYNDVRTSDAYGYGYGE